MRHHIYIYRHLSLSLSLKEVAPPPRAGGLAKKVFVSLFGVAPPSFYLKDRTFVFSAG